MEEINKDKLICIFNHLETVFTENKDYLIDLDSEMGDGDLGLTMEKAFSAASSELKRMEESDLGKTLAKIGMAIAKAAPSTMGTLMASGFMKGGKAVFGRETLCLSDVAAFFEGFVVGIMARGKSQPGDKTVVDSLFPVSEVLKKGPVGDLVPMLESAVRAAEEGLEKTKDMVAKHGRIAYYQERAKGKQDPGATVGFLFIKGIWEALKDPEP